MCSVTTVYTTSPVAEVMIVLLGLLGARVRTRSSPEDITVGGVGSLDIPVGSVKAFGSNKQENASTTPIVTSQMPVMC